MTSFRSSVSPLSFLIASSMWSTHHRPSSALLVPCLLGSQSNNAHRTMRFWQKAGGGEGGVELIAGAEKVHTVKHTVTRSKGSCIRARKSKFIS